MERTWLDLNAPPLAERAALSGWAPDVATAYCPRCGRSSSGRAVGPGGCAGCRDIRLAWDRMIRLGPYGDPLGRWVREVKFTRWARLGSDLGRMLGERLLEELPAHGPGVAPPILVPVPDSGLRRLLRGIDHTLAIARGVRSVTGWEIVQPLCRRFGPTQVVVTPSERAANVARSFGLRSGAHARLARAGVVVVIDDVCTTGATLRACCRLLAGAVAPERKLGGTAIWTAVLARAEAPPRRGGRGQGSA